ncbi:MAG: protein kinase [Dokdonella sp.]
MTFPGRSMQPESLAASATVTGMLAAADLRPGELIAGRYRIERLLGIGGMGVVYLARDIELDIDIALKLLRPELAHRPDAFERFRQELLLARQVSSPHVVRIHDLVKHGQAWLISMDYVAGQSLEHLLDARGFLPPDEAIRMTRQLALGLAAAHHRGVVHRDLKPANVLVNEQGDGCVTDFGVARSAGGTGITGSGVIIGTPEYLSPEQARADPIDGRSDLYALGLILFEMLTGTLPFRGGTPAEMLAQRVVREPPTADSIKPDLPVFAVRLCARLLELKPARRFQSADDVVSAIDLRRVPGLPRKQRVALTLTACAIFVIALVGGWLQLRPPDDAARTAFVAASLDLAALPLTTASSDPADIALATGISRQLTDALATNGTLRSADYLQVTRALSELGYDPATAQRHRDRVADTLHARHLIDGELIHDEQGFAVKLAFHDPHSEQPTWTAATPVSNAQDFPGALRRLQQSVQQKLGTNSATGNWPEVAELQAIGRYHHVAPAPAELEKALTGARASGSATVWWALLQSLDRANRNADASIVARQLIDALASDPSTAALRARAYAQLLLGKDDAGKNLEQLAKATPGDHPIRLLLARAQGDAGQFDQALATLNALVTEDPRDIDAWFELGKNAIKGGDAKRAVDDYLVRAQVLANRLDDRRMRADVTNAMGVGYRHLGQIPAAIEQFDHAASLREAIGDTRGQAVSLRNLATMQSMQGDFAKAEAALDKARTMLEPLGDSAAMADLTNDVGVFNEERGDLRQALESYRAALALRQAGGDPHLIGESLINVGFVYYQVGEFDNAQVYWQQADATYAKIDDRSGAVNVRLSLALALIARGEFKQARDTLDQSLREAEELQLAEARVVGIATLAELDRLEGSITSALERSATALQQFEKSGDPRGTVEMKLLRSAIFCDVGDWDSAAGAIDGLNADSVASGEQASLLVWRQGEIALGHGAADVALAKADEAIVAAKKAHSFGTELSAHLLRARTAALQNHGAIADIELETVETGLAHYASVPVRLLLVETLLRVTPAKAAASYREGRALLAHLPAYGRAFVVHALAATALRDRDASAASTALLIAHTSYANLRSNTPSQQLLTLAALAESLGLNLEGAP